MTPRHFPSKRLCIAIAVGLGALAGCGLTPDDLNGLGDAGGTSDVPNTNGDAVNPTDGNPGQDTGHATDTGPVDVYIDPSCGMSCDDGNPCTDDACVNRACTHTNNTAACDDGNACNGADTCSAGTCSVHSGAPNCDDGNPCTTDTCSTGACQHANNTASCPGGTCSGGTCVASTTGCGGVVAELGPPDYSRAGTGAVPSGASSNQQMAIQRGNYWRTSAGIQALNGNALLDQSATNHANFCNANPQSSCWPGAHDETSSCSGYTGQWPWDRMTSVGYAWNAAAEDMAFVTNPISAVDEWIWTPYHRQPFMSASYIDTGYGETGAVDVMDFGSTGGTATTPPTAVFPVPGQTGVPRSFDGNESPTPPSPPGGFPSGTVISISLASAGNVTVHQLWDASCNPVAHVFTNQGGTGSPDPQYWFMYGNTPLAPNAQYTVQLGGTVGSSSFSRTWVFHTGAT